MSGRVVCRFSCGAAGKRIFLDELHPDRGDMATEPEIECSIMCALAEDEIGKAA
jgi:hypothetical protein